MGGIANLFHSVFEYFGFGGASQPNKKRRAEDNPNQDSKIRRVDYTNVTDGGTNRQFSELHRRSNPTETDFLPLNQVKRGTVHITKWGMNGKENRAQYLPHYNSSSNSGAGRYPEEVQVLEENFKRNSLFGRGMGSTSSYKNATRSCSDDEIEEIFPPPRRSFKKKSAEVTEIFRSPQVKKNSEIIETYRSPHLKKREFGNEVQILKECASSSKEAHGSRSPFPRKPFKAIDPCVQASSTPILFSGARPRIRSPDEPVIVQSPSLTNGIEPCQYRAQSSSFCNPNYSRKNSTLLHMKRFEESQVYDKVFRSSYGADRLLIQQASSPTSPKSIGTDLSGSYSRSSFTCRPLKMSGSTNMPSSSKDILPAERINVSVERTPVNEPSTSASRQTDDPELQCLGEVQTSVPKVPQYEFLEEVLQKYDKMERERLASAEQGKRDCKLLEERNRLALLDRQKQATDVLVDEIQAYLRLVEEPALEEEEEEKVAPLPELTDAMNAEINRALAAPPDAVLSSAFNLTIKGRDMRTLKDLAWLNDEVINFYMNMIIERGKADNYPSVHAFNTFFFPKLISTGYDSLKRWTKKVDIFAHDYLLIPVHRGMHWCMAIIDMKEKVIRYYDSMDGRFPQCMDALLNYLHKESMDKKKQPFDATGWVKEHAENIPQQNNGSDCGMFACMYAEYISRGAPITFTQENMPYFRRKAVYEILKAKLLC